MKTLPSTPVTREWGEICSNGPRPGKKNHDAMGDCRLSVLALDRAVYDDGLPVRDLRSLPVRRRLPQRQPVDARSSHVHCTGAGAHTAARRARGAGRTYTRQPLALPFSSVNPSTLGRRRGSRRASQNVAVRPLKRLLNLSTCEWQTARCQSASRQWRRYRTGSLDTLLVEPFGIGPRITRPPVSG